jgi:glutaredoxin 2
VPFFVFHITYYYCLLQKIDEEAVEHSLEIIHSVLNVVNRLIESGDGSMDFQVLAMKLDYIWDYLQRFILVGLNVDDFIVAMVGQAWSVMNELDNADDLISSPSSALSN